MDNLSEEVNSSEGLSFFPFGNGSERLFNHNKNLNAMIAELFTTLNGMKTLWLTIWSQRIAHSVV